MVTNGNDIKSKSAMQNFGKWGWSMIIYCAILYFFTSCLVDTLNVSVDAFASQKNWNAALLLSFSGIGGWVGVIIAVVLAQVVAKIGPRKPTIISLFIFGVLFILYGMVPTVAAYAVVVVIATALANSLNLVSTNTIMANWFPQKKGIALGWATMGMPLSTMLAVPLFAFLLSSIGITGSFAVFGAGILVIAFISIFWLRNTPEEVGAYPDNEPISQEEMKANLEKLESHKSEWTVKKLLSNKMVWLVSLVFGILFLVLMAVLVQLIPRLMSLGFEQGTAIILIMTLSLAGLPGSYFWGWLDQKTSTQKATVVYTITMTIVIACMIIFASNHVLTVVSVVLFGTLVGGLGNLLPSMVLQAFGRYEFASTNRVIVPIVTAVRVSSFIIMGIVLGITGSFQSLYIVLLVLAAITIPLALLILKALNKRLEETETAAAV